MRPTPTSNGVNGSAAFAFRFPLANGLHARPASHLAEFAGRFHSSVVFENTRTTRTANAKSVLALVGTDTRLLDECRLRIEGVDEESASTELKAFIDTAFLRCDEPLAAPPQPSGDPIIPRSLREAGLSHFQTGAIASRGLGEGRLVVARAQDRLPELRAESPGDPAHEQSRFTRALAELRSTYVQSAASARGTAAAILQAHLSLLNDPALIDQTEQHVASGKTAGQAVLAAINRYVEMLANSESFYIRERVLDLEDVGTRLLEILCGRPLSVPMPVLDAPSILVADRLTPSQFLALDRRYLRGLVLGQTGPTSHTVILARSFSIPTLSGVSPAAVLGRAAADTLAILDAQLGLLITDPPEGVRRFYRRERAKIDQIEAGFASIRDGAAATSDGRRLEVAANIVSGEESAGAFAQGAEGIGLFRTELLFADRTTAPDEDEQYAIYASVVRAAEGRPVIIRTLDIGGDKPVPFLKLPAENNPFLGYRGVRLYAEHAKLVSVQLRALLRAARHGPLKILVPMVSSVEEARLVRTLLAAERDELNASGIEQGHDVALGLMLEVPAVAFIVEELCEFADFFSLGTNDLTQYFLAADRENPQVASLYSPFHPAFLRFLKHIADRVRSQGRWLGLCGEMADDPLALPLLVALGLDEISLAASRIPATKAGLAQLDSADCSALLQRALACATREEVVLELNVSRRKSAPMLTADLVLNHLECDTKAEVIRAMVDALQIAGRTTRAAAIEESVWRREDSYSTGFGEGFAMPHCKTDDISVSSVVVARLLRPVAWQSLDGSPTDVVILLVVRASDHARDHMRSLSRFSRLVMQEEFRDSIRACNDSAQLASFILEQIGEESAPGALADGGPFLTQPIS